MIPHLPCCQRLAVNDYGFTFCALDLQHPRLLQRQGKGELVGDYFSDIVVEGRIILELKSIEKLQPVHEAQLLNYLKATGIQVGLLINFTHPKAEIKRMVFNLSEGRGES